MGLEVYMKECKCFGRKKNIEEWRKEEEIRIDDTRMGQGKQLLELGLFPFLNHIPLFFPPLTLFSPFFSLTFSMIACPLPFSPAVEPSYGLGLGRNMIQKENLVGGDCYRGRIRVQLFCGERERAGLEIPKWQEVRNSLCIFKAKLDKGLKLSS